MKKNILSIALFACLALSGCSDSKKTDGSPPAQQDTPAASQQDMPKKDESTAGTPETVQADTGIGLTGKEYQAAYNAQVQQFNIQMKQDPVRMQPLNLKIRGRKFSACTMSYACLDGTMTEDGKYIRHIAVSGTLTLKKPRSLALAPVHMMIGAVSAIPGASIQDIKGLLDKLADEAQKRQPAKSSTVFMGYQVTFSHPKVERIVLSVEKEKASSK